MRERNVLAVATGLSWDGFSGCSLWDRHIPSQDTPAACTKDSQLEGEKYLEKAIKELRAAFDVWVRISSQL